MVTGVQTCALPISQTEQSEEGGMLVAAIAGVGILVAVGLLIFSGGGDKAAADAGARPGASAAVDSAGAGGAKSAFEKREVDAAGKPILKQPRNGAPTTRKTAAQSPIMAGGGGLSNEAPSRKPPTFDNPDDERAWWETQLSDAKRLQGMRMRGMEKLPQIEKDIEGAADPEQARAAYELRKKRLEKALANSEKHVAELEAKLIELQ